jgi:YD repeat-containing protein
LTGLAPDQYGNFTTFTYRSKDQTLLTFNAVNSTTLTGQIASWNFPNGMSLGLAYNYTYNNATYLTGVTNNLGRSLTLAYSGAHVSSVTDDTGRAITFGYDSNNNLTSFTDPLSTFAYDGAAGHLTQMFYPSNPGVAFVSNTYDAIGHVIQQANANGNTSLFYIAGSRTEFIDPAGDRHITYQTPHGKIIKDASVLNNSVGNIFNDTVQLNGVVNITTNQYDGQDRLVLATAPERGTVAYTYSVDLLHNVTRVTQTPKPGSPLASLVTSYAYDPVYNKPTTITDPRGLITTMSYDGATGNLLSVVADAGSALHFNPRSTFTYNGVGQVLTVTDPLGTVALYAYDNRGNQISVTRDYGISRLNQLTRIGYSAIGDANSLTDPNGNVTTSTYDAARRLTTVTSPSAPPAAPNGTVTTFTYDPDGRVIQVQQSAGVVVLRIAAATYSFTGQMATATDANGNVTSYTYDIVDRLMKVTDAMGRVTSYAYDALSRRTQVLNAAIQVAPLLQQGYSPDGLLASLTDANGNIANFAYDGFDRLATTIYPGGSTEGLTYDADGNFLSRKTRANQTITYAYDTLNRLTTKTPPSPAPVVSYAYDLSGRLTAVSDTSVAISPAAPPSPSTSVQYAMSYTYDSLNRPTGVTWSPTPVAVPSSTGATVTFAHTYNKTNQRSGQTTTDNSWWLYPAATPSTVSYTANALNQYTAVGARSRRPMTATVILPSTALLPMGMMPRTGSFRRAEPATPSPMPMMRGAAASLKPSTGRRRCSSPTPTIAR